MFLGLPSSKMHLPFKVFPQHNSNRGEVSVLVPCKGATMKKLALGLVIAAFSSGVFAQTETPGGAAAGAGGAAGTATVSTTTIVLVTVGLVAAGAVAASSNSSASTTHH